MATENGTTFALYPAIDLRGGRCVRLERGEADRETVYGTDPLEVAAEFARCGASWLHVVDLDAAFGDGSNRDLITRLVNANLGLRVQTGGGIRRESDLEAVLGGGASRAVIGTAAVERPDFVAAAVARWGSDRIAVGIDARGRRPAIRGWREETATDLFDLTASLVELGVRTFIYTDIDRDGMFTGPNVETSIELASRCGCDVIVSGGVGGMDDLRRVAAAARLSPGIAGVIVGKAIYEGRVELAAALREMP